MGSGSRLVRVAAAVLLFAATGLVSVWALADPDRMPTAVLAVGSVAFALIVATAVRYTGWSRTTWLWCGLGLALWTGSLVGTVLDWSGWLTWGVLRGSAYLAIGIALVITPGVRRGWRDWGLLLMDGWLVAASAFEVAWVALDLGGGRAERLIEAAPISLLVCMPVNLTAATVVVGMAIRADAATRVPSATVAAATLLAVAADGWWLTTGDEQVAVVLWLFMQMTLAVATLAPTTRLWATPVADPEELQLARLAHVAVVPGLLAAAAAPAPDAVSVVLAVSLVLVLGGEILISSAQMRALWQRTQAQTRRLDTVLRESMDAIVRLSPEGQVQFANPAAAEVFGLPEMTFVGCRLADLIHPQDRPAVREQLAAAVPSGTTRRVVSRFLRHDGTWRHIEATVSRPAGDGGGLVVIARDIEHRIRLEAELRRQASTDALTGLLNRQAFLARLEEALLSRVVAVLFLDLDEFKSVNDTRGHEAGDALLVRVGCAIATAAGPDRPVARLGGDEFAVLVPLPPTGDLTGARRLAGELVARLDRDCEVGAGGVSIGIARGQGGQAEEVLGNADLAMYEAKGAGGGQVAVFEPAMRQRVLTRSQLRSDLEQVIAEGRLDVDLQPIVDLATGRWVGFEALVRWPDGDRRRPPSEFVPLAEETGLVVPLGAWVLGAALDWLAAWPDPDAGVSVNVTGRQVAELGFADLVRAELARTGVEPSRLTLEITEQTAVEDLGRAGEVLQPLRSLGVHVALDDFGTGFSSLGYLAQLPVDELKIDRKFVSGLGRRSEDDALVRAVLRLAADLGLQVVAEGVETAEQAAILRGYACPLAQGYLYSRPVPHAALRPQQVPADPPGLPRQHVPQVRTVTT